MTTFLKFNDEGHFLTELAKLKLSPASEIKGDGFALSVIGLIPDGGEAALIDEQGEAVLDEDGLQVMQPTYIDGWHVNLLGDLPSGWDAMVVQVNSPVRVFG
jgi:hypothetical protein